MGLHDAPHGLLQNMALRAHVRPVSALTHDPTHILFSNGMVHTELDSLVLAPWERPMTFRGMNGLPSFPLPVATQGQPRTRAWHSSIFGARLQAV